MDTGVLGDGRTYELEKLKIFLGNWAKHSEKDAGAAVRPGLLRQ
jgi:hypothetical protein